MRQSTNRDMTLSVELEKGQTDTGPRPLTENSETLHAALITAVNITRVHKKQVQFPTEIGLLRDWLFIRKADEV